MAPMAPPATKIPLSDGSFALVDSEDAALVNQWRWKNSKGRAMRNRHVGTVGDWRNGKRKDEAVLMHRVIMKAPPAKEVDHINGDPLDNRKVNLRVCSHQNNRANNKSYSNNTTGFKGVYKEKRTNKWYAGIRFMGKSYTLATFDNPREAALEYDHVAKQLFGEFASLNFGEKA